MTTYQDTAGRKIASEQAMRWLCDLRDGDETTRDAFFAWLKQSPQHVEEFLLASSVWQALDGIGTADDATLERAIAQARASGAEENVVKLEAPRVTSAPAPVPHNRIRKGNWRWAAGIAALLLAGTLGWRLMGAAPTYATAVGEQRTVRLDDGSLIYLNAASRVRVRFSGAARVVKLLQGEGLFTVARDAHRPFRVLAGTATIQALGTQFNVKRRGDSAIVSVVEGSVRLTSADRPAAAAPIPAVQTLAAGEEANVAPQTGIIKRAAPEVAAALAWRERRLVFRGETLPQVAEEFNRYSRRPIRVEGEFARNKRLAGTFDADDPQSLLLFLAKEEQLALEEHDEEWLIRERID